MTTTSTNNTPVEIPPATAPAHKSFVMPSVQQAEQWAAHRDAMARQTVAMERQTAAMEAWQRDVARMVSLLAEPVKTAPESSASLAASFVRAMAPVTTMTEQQVIARARELVRIYRQFYPATVS